MMFHQHSASTSTQVMQRCRQSQVDYTSQVRSGPAPCILPLCAHAVGIQVRSSCPNSTAKVLSSGMAKCQQSEFLFHFTPTVHTITTDWI